MTECEGLRILPCQFNGDGVRMRPSHQALAGGFTEGRAELDARRLSNQGFVEILNRLDEVRLPEAEVGHLRLVNLHLDGLQGDFPVTSKRGRLAAFTSRCKAARRCGTARPTVLQSHHTESNPYSRRPVPKARSISFGSA